MVLLVPVLALSQRRLIDELGFLAKTNVVGSVKKYWNEEIVADLFKWLGNAGWLCKQEFLLWDVRICM